MTTATTESTALVAPTDNEIEQIRRRGAKAVAHRQEIIKLEKQIAGLTWGSGNSIVQGASLSPMARAAFAEFCAITRANPMTDIDILGNKPYLNSNYWSGLINTHAHFHHYEQRDLSPSVEQALRTRAAKHREIAATLSAAGKSTEAADRLARALDLEEEADDVALARAQWSPRENATVVVETTIVRFINAAPIKAIQRGEITDLDPYLIRIPECNHAGGMGNTMAQAKKWDPIGDANPGTTARTRSLRRAAVKSFSAWMQAYERQVAKAEEALEAEFEIIRSDRHTERAQLPAASGPQAVRIGSGEPSASTTNGAQPLPVEVEAPVQPRPATEERTNGDTKPARNEASAEEFDRDDARKALFATWRDASVEDRVKWSADHGLPESTKKWGPDQFAFAMDLLLAPLRKQLTEGASIVGADPEDLAQAQFGKSVASLTYRDLRDLVSQVNGLADAAEDEHQQDLLR